MRILDLLPLPCVDISIHSTHTIAVWDTSRAAVVHLNFRAGSTFSVPVCTLPSSMDRTSRCNKVDTVRLYASYRLNLLLLKGQRCVNRNQFNEHCSRHIINKRRNIFF